MTIETLTRLLTSPWRPLGKAPQFMDLFSLARLVHLKGTFNFPYLAKTSVICLRIDLESFKYDCVLSFKVKPFANPLRVPNLDPNPLA